jgi:hypothetical protein
MRGGRSIHRFLDQRDLSGILHRSQRGQHRLDVLKENHRVAVSQEPHQIFAGRRVSLRGHFRVDRGTLIGQQLRDFLGQFAHFFHAIETGQFRRFRIFGSHLASGVFFEPQISWWQKQDFGVGAGGDVTLSIGRRSNEKARSRHDHTREIVKIVLLAELIHRVHWLERRQQYDNSSRLLGQSFAAQVIVGHRLAIKGVGRRADE